MSISPLALLGNGMGQTQSLSGAFGESSFGVFGASGFASLLGGLLGGNTESEAGDDTSLLAMLLGGSADGSLSEMLSDVSFNMTDFLPEGGLASQFDVESLFGKVNDLADMLGKLGAGEGGATAFTQITHVEFEIVIEQVITEFKAIGIDASGLNTVAGLAAAFESLGMSAEDAMDRAVGYVAFMKYMEAEEAKQDEIELLKALLQGEDPSVAYQAFLASKEGGSDEAAGLLAFNARRSSVSISFSAQSTTIISGAELAHSALSGGDIPLAENAAKGPLGDIAQQVATGERPLNEKVISALQQAGIEGESGAFAAAARAASDRIRSEGGVASRTAEFVDGASTQVRGEYLKPQPLAEILSESRNVFTVSQSEQGALQVQSETTDPIDVNDSADFDAFMEKQVNNQNRPAGTERLAQMARQADVAAQMQMQVRQLAKQGGGEVKMVLNPPELGELDLHIRVSDGRVSGVIASQNMDVLEQMARDLRYLQEAFAESGLEFSEEGLSFQLKEEGSQSFSGGENAFSGSEDGEAEDGESGEVLSAEAQDPRWIDPDRLVDMDA